MDSNKIQNNTPQETTNNSYINQKTSNPIDVGRISPLNTRTSANRLYSGYNSAHIKPVDVDYNSIINSINSSFVNQVNEVHLFYEMHNKIVQKLNLNFSALGIFNPNSNYINIKLIDKTGASYNSKVMLSDDDNVIVKSFLSKQIIQTTDSNYLKLSYLSNAPTNLIPLMAFGECLGVIIFSDNTISVGIL